MSTEDLRIISTLTRFFARDLLQTRVASALLGIWAMLLVVSLWTNAASEKARLDAANQEHAALAEYYETLPHYGYLFQSTYLAQRPAARHTPFVSGVEYGAPNLVDFRPRESPTFYHGDDVDPVARVFRPLDLVFVVGILGFLVALLLGYDSVNAEVENGNAGFLSLFGVNLWHVYAAKAIVLAAVLCGSFLVVYLAALVPVIAVYGKALGASLPHLAVLGAISVGYLLYAAATITAVSAICARRASSFLVGTAIFLVTVYVVPNTSVFIERMKTAEDEAAVGELMQAAARDAHLRLDPHAAKVIVSLYGAPPDVAAIEAMEAAGLVVTRPDGTTANAGRNFVNENSEASIRLAVAELERAKRKNLETVALAMPASPFIAAAHSMAIVAGTGIEDEHRLLRSVSESHARAYRDWWFSKQGTPGEKRPVEKFIFRRALDPTAQSGRTLSMAGIAALRYPEVRLGEAVGSAAKPAAVPLFYAVLLWGLGLFAAVRRGRLAEGVSH